MILQQTHTGGRTIEGTPEKWHIMVLGIQTPRDIWSHKEELTKTLVLTYLDPKADHIIQVDGSMKDLGAVLLHKGRPVIYVARMLIPAETGYFNIIRELICVVFRLERLQHYIFGSKDWPQAIDTIWKKSIVAASPPTSMTTALTDKIWCGNDISEGQRQCYCRCPQQVSPMEPLAVD